MPIFSPSICHNWILWQGIDIEEKHEQSTYPHNGTPKPATYSLLRHLCRQPTLLYHIIWPYVLSLVSSKKATMKKSLQVTEPGSDSDGIDQVHDQRIVIPTKFVSIADSLKKREPSR